MGLLDFFKRKQPVDLRKQIEQVYEGKFKDFIATLDPFITGEKETLPGWKVISSGDLGYQAKRQSGDYYAEFIEWVYANVRTVARAVGSIEFKLYKTKKSGEVDEVDEHPVLELLYKVNPYMNKTEFVELLETNLKLTGEAPIRLRGSQQSISEMWPLNPGNLDIFIGKTSDGFEMIDKFKYTYDEDKKKKTLILKPWEVVFIRTLNPSNIWRGLGDLEASRRTVDTLTHSENYSLNFFMNGAVPLTILKTENKLDPTVYERLKNTWDKKFKGTQNAFKTAVLEAGLDIKQLQSNAKDMDLLEQKKFLRDKVMAMFGTNKAVMGITDDVNRANAEASEYVFMKHTVIPEMKRLVDYLNEFLMPLFDDTGDLFLDFEDPITENSAEKAKVYSQAVDKWMTKNEIRKELDLPELEGGDEIWQALALTTMSNPTPNTSEVQTEPKPEGEQGKLEETPEGTIEEPKGTLDETKQFRIFKAKKKRITPRQREMISKLRNRNIRIKQAKEELEMRLKDLVSGMVYKGKTKKKQKYIVDSQKSIQRYWKKLFIKTGGIFEVKLTERFVETIYKGEIEDIERNIKAKGIKFLIRHPKKMITKSADNYMFDKDKYIKMGIDLFMPLFEELMKSQGKEAMAFVGSRKPYKLLDEAIKFLTGNTRKLSKETVGTTYETVRKALTEGIKKGESEEELIARLTKKYKELEHYQAQAIARTEVSRATNKAALDAYKQSGVVKAKRWVTAQDERVCDYCAPMNGQVMELETNYFNLGDEFMGDAETPLKIDYAPIEGGTLHTNCRCTIVAEFEPVKMIKPPKKKKINPQNLLEKIEKELEDAGRED